MSTDEILARHKRPIIAVLGSIEPDIEFELDDAVRLGYMLGEFCKEGGTVMTGGVQGVGVAAYSGLLDYCSESRNNISFFVLLPCDDNIQPIEYMDLASRSGHDLVIERIGRDMAERRVGLASVADIAVICNGAQGTLDEAINMLIKKKDIIVLANSGGAAKYIASELRRSLNTIHIISSDSVTDAIEYLREKYGKKT